MDNALNDATLQRIEELIDEKLYGWFETTLTHIPNFIVALVILVVFFITAKIVAMVLRKVFYKGMESHQVADLMLTIMRIIIIGLGCFIALDFLGLKGTVTSLLAGAGIVGLALGFAFQDITENFIAAVAMGIRKPFRPGDIIQTSEVFGTVKYLNFRNTIIETFSGQLEIVPNKHLFRNVLTNYSYSGERRIDVPVGISYSDDIDAASKAITNKLNTLNGVIRQDETSCYAAGFGDSSIDLVARFWIHYPDGDYLRKMHEAVAAIHSALNEEGISIPFPIRTLDFAVKAGQALDESVIQFKKKSQA